MNKAMLIGNVGKDPDVRYYEQDQAVVQVSLVAKVVEQYVRKGDRLYVEGRIRYRAYDTKKGERRYVTEILVENMEMLSPKPTQAQAPVTPQQPAATPDDTPF